MTKSMFPIRIVIDTEFPLLREGTILKLVEAFEFSLNSIFMSEDKDVMLARYQKLRNMLGDFVIETCEMIQKENELLR